MACILAVDTCGATGYAALFDTESALPLAEELLPGRETQERLLPAIAGMLSSTDCKATELNALAVVAGPGSFTGVRIGMATVKGLVEALGLPVISLSRLTVLGAAASNATASGGRLHAWLDAGRGEVYIATPQLQGGAVLSPGEEHLQRTADALAQCQPGDTIAVLEPSLLEVVKPLGVLIPETNYRSNFLRHAANAYRTGDFAEVALLDANYLRVPDAEIAMRTRTAAFGSATTLA